MSHKESEKSVANQLRDLDINDPARVTILTQWISKNKIALAMASKANQGFSSSGGVRMIVAGNLAGQPDDVRARCKQELYENYSDINGEQISGIMQVLEQQSALVTNNQLCP